jgi:hypothetical protein
MKATGPLYSRESLYEGVVEAVEGNEMRAMP